MDVRDSGLLHVLLARLGVTVGSVLDDLDRVCKLGLLAETSEAWIAARALATA